MRYGSYKDPFEMALEVIAVICEIEKGELEDYGFNIYENHILITNECENSTIEVLFMKNYITELFDILDIKNFDK